MGDHRSPPSPVWPEHALADVGLRREAAQLLLGDVSLTQVAQRFATPCYVMSAQQVRRPLDALRAALQGVPHRLCYAVKASSNLHLLRWLAQRGVGADVVSGGELRRARLAGIPADSIVFSGIGKRDDELLLALQEGIRAVHVESLAELRRYEQLAHARGLTAPVCIRVNPRLDVNTHPYLATGLEGSKFGVDLDDVDALFDCLADSDVLRLVGLSAHLGSQIVEASVYAEAGDVLAALAERWQARGGAPLEYLDLGGGFASAYAPGDPAFELESFGQHMAQLAQRTGCTLQFEPGRYLVANAGVLLTRVLWEKTSGRVGARTRYVVVDAAMNDLVRPALYAASHAVVQVEHDPAGVGTRGSAPGAPVPAQVVGPVCESGDFLACDVPLPVQRPGALLAVLSAGAYGASMASRYNARTLPAEVWVEDGAATLVRARERVEDGWAHELSEALQRAQR